MALLKKARFLSLVAITLLLTACETQLTGILNPKGVIAFQERQLLFDALALMLVVVLPVIVMSIAFIWRYRENHPTAEYRPNWSHSVLLESIWWGVPLAIIMILGIMTWETTHELDPYNRIDPAIKPLPVQVVALPWKWLFIYPEHGIATVNELHLAKGKPVEFELSSDNVPMSAFFVPQLGSQIYTMAGMRTKLNLLATHTGTFTGLNSQYNGEGFSDMHFKVHVHEPADLKKWLQSAQNAGPALNKTQYAALRENSIAHPVEIYSAVEPNLFNTIIHSYKTSDHPTW